MSSTITIPAILESVSTRKDRTLKLIFGTNELSPSQAGQLLSDTEKFGWLAFKGESFNMEETKAIESLKAEANEGFKSDSQRLRAVLYRTWEANNEGFSTFARYYSHVMEQIINHYKSKLP
jgi:hypothetical protein